MFGSFWVTLGKKAISWDGCNKIFGLPFLMILAMTVLCACVLAWIFLEGLGQTICAYFVYALSAYFLVALCVRLPSGIRYGKQWVSHHPKIFAVLKNEELKFKMEQQNKSFDYIYSAAQRQEIEQIRKKYLPQEVDKMQQLRHLHHSATRKAQSWSIGIGSIGALVLETGMSLAMTELGAGLGRWAMAVVSPVGLLGLVLVALAYPVYN